MSFVDQDTADRAAASTVRIATLVELRFTSETKYLWNGAGPLDVAGAAYEGANGFGGIDGLPSLRSTTSEKVNLTFAAVSGEALALAANSKDEVRGRLAFIWLQLFNEDWQPVGARVPAFWGIMHRAVIEREAATELTGGTRTMGLEIENPYFNRARATLGRFTDQDQKQRSPTDRVFEFVSAHSTRVLIWPNY